MPEWNQWIAPLFEALLRILRDVGLKESSPAIFLVYAHDTGERRIHKPADAKVARELIRWLSELGANIYSDQTATGNDPFIGSMASEQARVHDILSSQRCLLPPPQEKIVDKIILCGSARLGHYGSSRYYQESYYPALKKAYISDSKQACHAETQKIPHYVSSKVKDKDFHHVLTELAFLQLRADSLPESHGIIPMLLNGTSKTSFPPCIDHSTTIRIEETKWRAAGHWEGQTIYENQGLHQGFFKLLKRLWVNQELTIQLLGEEVYTQCLQALQGSQPPTSLEALMKMMEDHVLKAQQHLIRQSTSTVRRVNIQTVVTDVIRQALTKPPVEADAIRKAYDKAIRPRLRIQRISGEALPMEQCYINLAVVESQPRGAKQNADFHRLPSFEAFPTTNLQKAIPLAELFQSRRLRNETIGVPKRILIHGRAGIGKTTLSKKSVYDYLDHRQWQAQFDWVLWIPLRGLKEKPEAYQLEKLLYDDYFCGTLTGKAFARALSHQIEATPARTLLILDGWDEIAADSHRGCIQALLNHPRVIITTRPYGVNLSQMKPDLELETIGFSEANVRAYLNHPVLVEPGEAREIQRFIHHQPIVQDLVNIPIQLDALCYSWDVIKYEQTDTPTMTGVYEAMVHKLWCKDIPRLGKEEAGKPVTAEVLHALRNPSRLAPYIRWERDSLGLLALNGLHRNQIEFKPADLDEVIDALTARHQASPPSQLEANLNKLSCLHVEWDAQRKRPRSYQFLHLSFQEFFAAHWLVSCLKTGSPLSLAQVEGMWPSDFIRANQYHPRYEMLWRFTAGLLREKALADFFEVLEQGPQDLIGIQHQRLLMGASEKARAAYRLPNTRHSKLMVMNGYGLKSNT